MGGTANGDTASLPLHPSAPLGSHRSHALPQLASQPFQVQQPEPRFVQEVGRARRERLERRLRSFLSVGGEHDDTQAGIARQQRSQHREPVHAGHVEIEGDHVGGGLGNAGERLNPSRRFTDYPQVRIQGQHLRRRPAGERGVVHHKHPDHSAPRLR
jgi:hypothetical protein